MWWIGVLNAVCGVQCAAGISKCAVWNVQGVLKSAVCSVHCVMFSIQCAQCVCKWLWSGWYKQKKKNKKKLKILVSLQFYKCSPFTSWFLIKLTNVPFAIWFVCNLINVSPLQIGLFTRHPANSLLVVFYQKQNPLTVAKKTVASCLLVKKTLTTWFAGGLQVVKKKQGGLFASMDYNILYEWFVCKLAPSKASFVP